MCAVNPVMGMINTAMTDWLNALGGSSKVLLGAIVAGMMSVDMGGPVNKAAYVFGTAALASGNYEVMAASWWAAWCSHRHCSVHHLLPPQVDVGRTPQRHRELRHGPVLRV